MIVFYRKLSEITEEIKLNFVSLRGITIIVSIRNQQRQWLGAPKNSIKTEIGISTLLSRDPVAGGYLNRTAMAWTPQSQFLLPCRKKEESFLSSFYIYFKRFSTELKFLTVFDFFLLLWLIIMVAAFLIFNHTLVSY